MVIYVTHPFFKKIRNYARARVILPNRRNSLIYSVMMSALKKIIILSIRIFCTFIS